MTILMCMIDCDLLMQILGDRGGGDGRSGVWSGPTRPTMRGGRCARIKAIMMMIRDDGDYCSGVDYVVQP